MSLQLTDKLALITGSTKGIGLAIATSLAREGAQVVINGRSDKSVTESLEFILSATGGCVVRICRERL